MEFFYTQIAFLTAGVALVTGLINLFIGLSKYGEKVDIVFGLMSLTMFVFFMLPPAGFILLDKAPYSLQIDIKRVFNNAFVVLFPWFVIFYTGHGKKIIAYLIDALVVVYYASMMTTTTDSQKPQWVYLVLVTHALSVVFGFYAGFLQARNGEKKKAQWFLFAMGVYAVVYILTFINQVGDNYFGRIMGTKLFFPINLFPLAFMLIMSIRLRANVTEKYHLEKMLHWRDMQWNSIVQNMQLLIVELDNHARIEYLNPYAVKALGYSSLTELKGKNWFDIFAPKEEIEQRKSVYLSATNDEQVLHWKSNIVTRNGTELFLKWTNVFVYDGTSRVKGTMSIGLNVTDKENAFKEITHLKSELEKESLLLPKDPLKENEPGIIGLSEAIMYAIQKAKQVALTNAIVLLEGETGVGKELFASLIHNHSLRNNKSLIKVNCAALPPELIESELFGHEKGSFTGAVQARKGRFELANGGTIFLDEIGELPLALQPKLLRVLQSGEFERIGGQETLKVDVRVISATNRNLSNEVNAKHFREDLYYRLNVFPITIPALRDRKEDIPLLVKHYVKKFSDEHNKQFEDIPKADMQRLIGYQWPGNIRELVNVIERSVISSPDNTLKIDWSNKNLSGETVASSFAIEEVERAHILKVLKECNWKINGDDGAAVKLGLNPNTLRSRLKKLNISRIDA